MKSLVHLITAAATIGLTTATVSGCGGGTGSADSQGLAVETGVAEAGVDMTTSRWKRSATGSTTTTTSVTTTTATTPATIDTNASTSTVAPAVTVADASLTLSNLPESITTSGAASITYQLSTGGSTYKVVCRRDAYTPIACPNPFVLGLSAPLAAGAHQVDYYIDRGTTLDLSRPDASYAWTVASSTSTTTTAPVAVAQVSTPSTGSTVTAPTATVETTTVASATAATTTTSPSTSTATPLSSLPYPVKTAIQGTNNPSVAATSTVTGSDGLVRLAAVADPGGSGKQVFLHRIARNDGNVSGTSVNSSVRSEKVWIDQNKYMFPGKDYWFAFAFRPKAGEWPAPVSGMSDDEFLVMQTHSESNGDTQPPIGLYVRTGLQSMSWHSSASAATQATSAQVRTVLQSQALPQTETWYKYVVHMRPGYLASQNPRTEIWMATGSSGYTKIVDSTALVDYNWNTGSYARIGFYKWAGTNWSSNTPTIAAYFTSLYMEEGTNKFDAAAAALSGLQ